MEKKKCGRRPLPKEKSYRKVMILLLPADIDLLDDASMREGVSRSEMIRRMMEPELRKLRGE